MNQIPKVTDVISVSECHIQLQLSQ